MQFRLTYEGILLGASKSNTRGDHKHEIRKVFHHQLRRLWSYGFLSRWEHWDGRLKHPNSPSPKMYEALAEKYSRNGYSFVPLCTEELTLSCAISILFLRPDEPGSLIKSGDIDNRLKTLFDSLRLPTNGDELGRYSRPDVDEQPFYCLLEDDRLITNVSVETDVLLQPVSQPASPNDARLIVTVSIRPANVTMGNISFV